MTDTGETGSLWYRETAVAGTFYPRERAVLQTDLKKYLSPPVAERRKVTAIVAPHAGYIYSGKFAGQVYRSIEIPKRVVILCPNHSGLGRRISVWSEGSWETPLGDVPVDQTFAESCVAGLSNAESDQEAHLYEHAIEVHLPFLRELRPDVEIVPITLGPLQADACLRLGEQLGALVSAQKTPTLLVASTDMSHYLPADEAKKKDKYALNSIEALDPAGLYRNIVEHDISMCGFIPTTVTLAAARKLKATRAQVLCYGHSGEASGDLERVVAYAGAVIAL